jgi:hypothetical protein
LKDFPLNKSELEELVELLQESIISGFSTQTPPLVPMLEILIDLNLRVANFFKEGGPNSFRSNPSLKETGKADSLGNEKIVKIFSKPKWVHPDPKVSFLFKRTAEGLVKFKNTGNPIFLATFMVAKKQGTNNGPSIKQQKALGQNKNTNFWYFKRKAQTKKRNL